MFGRVYKNNLWCYYKPFLTYFNKFNGEVYKKKLKIAYTKTKIGYLNNKNVFMKNNEKIENNLMKKYFKNS